MISYEMNEIRNITLLGHRGSGKSSLVEAMLYMSNTTSKMGSVDSQTSVSDFDKEEMKQGFSINTSVIPLEYLGHKYNILDTPGYSDFSGEVSSALAVSGGAVLVINGAAGVEVGTERAWRTLEEMEIPRIIFINKMNKGVHNYEKLLYEMKEKLGKKVAPFCIPIGFEEEFKGFVNVVDLKGRIFNGEVCEDTPIPNEIDITEVRNLLLEAIAETDERLLEKYFSGIEFTEEEIRQGLHDGVISGEIVPVVIGSASNGIGVTTLFEMLYNYLPTPQEVTEGFKTGYGLNREEILKRKVSVDEPFSAVIFKTIVDPYMGKISIFKVNSGTIKKDDEVLIANKNIKIKIGNISFFRGGKQIPSDIVQAGDIGATMKILDAQTGDTLCDKDNPIIYNVIEFPKPCLYMSIIPKEKSDDDKLSGALQRLFDEDPSFSIGRNFETKELILGGQGEKHLNILLNKLENKFGVNAILKEPEVSYRETIKNTVEAQGRHKKQSGGAGQFGEVFIKFEPHEDEFSFYDNIHGGVVPRTYIPAVEKGLIEAKVKGKLAGYPVINIKATLYDGSYHPVDSNEISFKQAAILAFRKGLENARCVILEPIVKMQIVAPDEYIGDIMGDMNKRRGRILGMEPKAYSEQLLTVEVPESEILKYAVDLKSLTQGRGRFEYEFLKYEELQENLAQKIIDLRKNR
ncbi:elongation factor G [Candidatus Cetobacterium colombiensis]|uniref:Elongation factor G n=1 Tax=Candidatus Cetobacterium colombiensis TaxID=3073100 RepID=A0ABU4W880_9FUSO|nr:elongation factor G [Candidatus Cetobacterium colombiensis]MDX8335390.1 elongation factor G [Candidatus Cetobacterium colombiensis]